MVIPTTRIANGGASIEIAWARANESAPPEMATRMQSPASCIASDARTALRIARAFGVETMR